MKMIQMIAALMAVATLAFAPQFHHNARATVAPLIPGVGIAHLLAQLLIGNLAFAQSMAAIQVITAAARTQHFAHPAHRESAGHLLNYFESLSGFG